MPVKQTFKYRDPRETRLLNQASKDQYGRQRNHVLYGFEWAASGSNRNGITLGRGAIYTQDGVKIFFDDAISFKVPTINPGQGLTGGPAGIIDFPFPKNIIIGIQHNFVASATAQDAKLVLIEVRTSQKDQEPAYYIQEIDTITLTPLSTDLIDPDRLAYNGLYDTRPDGVITTVQRIATQKIENSIPNNVTPILKIRIQQIHQGGTVAIPPYIFTTSGQLEEGIEVVRYKNTWQQLNDMLGVNIFEPLISTDQNALNDLTYPTDKRETQDFVKNTAVTLPSVERHTPTQHPLFGTFDPNVANNYAGYRFASFLMDGRTILEGMKRIDAWLRLLVNRTGEQQLVTLTDSLTELNDIVNQGKVIVGDQNDYGGNNFMLREGKVYHVEPGNGPTYGDTHRRALHFLDMSIEYICNRLGLTPMMTRAEIEIDDLDEPELWDVSNPPGLDITANMNFHIALQTLRDFFTSRGNEVITGRHIYSLIDVDRDQDGGSPPGQKLIIDNDEITITDDVEYIQLKKGEIDSSNNRSDKIDGTEVATLDSNSRYRVDIIASHDPAHIAAKQGPEIEGVINAPQGVTQVGLGNIIGYTRNWSHVQLTNWANILAASPNPVAAVSHHGDGLQSEWGTFFEPEIYHYVYKDNGGNMSYAFSIDNLLSSGNQCEVSLVFYNNAFAEVNETQILSENTNGKKVVNGTITPIATAKFFRLRFKNAGVGPVVWGGISYWRNRVESHIYDNTPTTGAAGDALARKDYVDAQDALKQDKLTFDGTTYLDTAHNNVGESLRIVVNGVPRFIPSHIDGTGPCHSNCHSNCQHSDCGRTNAW